MVTSVGSNGRVLRALRRHLRNECLVRPTVGPRANRVI